MAANRELIDQDLIKILKDLASTCRDAEEGFNKAAKGAHSDEMRAVFDRYSVERSQFAAQWDRFVQQYGGDAGWTGHGGGVLRRGWIDLEQRIRPKGDAELARQAADGDEGGLAHYGHALAAGLPDDIREAVERQMISIRNAVDSLRHQHATQH